jgi:lysophospholipase L1-like esterase
MSSSLRTVSRPKLVLVLIAVGLVAAACAAPPGISRAGATGPVRYVSLGDSWVAGPLIAAPVGWPLDCGRAAVNWPSLVARELDAAQFVDVSCGGASTKHLTGPHRLVLGENPPQLDALTEDTDLVTLGIGGNDAGFPSFALRCVNLLPFELGPPPFGRPCVEDLTAGGVDRMSERIEETRPKVEAVLAEITRRAPAAEVFLVGYPVALPDSGRGCFPQVPLLDPDVRYLRDRFVQMNAMLATAAATAGVHYVDTYTPSIDHDVCRPVGQAWVNGVGMDPAGIPMHPNIVGHAGLAEVVAAAVRTGG